MPLAGARSTGRGKDGWPPPLVDRRAQRKSRSPVTPRHNPPEDWATSVVRNTFEIAEATGQLARLHTAGDQELTWPQIGDLPNTTAATAARRYRGKP